MIVKVQLPLNHKHPQALIYNEDRTIEVQWDFSNDLKTFRELLKLMRKEPKAFFFAKQDQQGMLHLEGIAPWQEW